MRERRRIAARVLPLVFAMYIVNYLDRANVAFAKAHLAELKPKMDAADGIPARK